MSEEDEILMEESIVAQGRAGIAQQKIFFGRRIALSGHRVDAVCSALHKGFRRGDRDVVLHALADLWEMKDAACRRMLRIVCEDAPYRDAVELLAGDATRKPAPALVLRVFLHLSGAPKSHSAAWLLRIAAERLRTNDVPAERLWTLKIDKNRDIRKIAAKALSLWLNREMTEVFGSFGGEVLRRHIRAVGGISHAPLLLMVHILWEFHPELLAMPGNHLASPDVALPAAGSPWAMPPWAYDRHTAAGRRAGAGMADFLAADGGLKVNARIFVGETLGNAEPYETEAQKIYAETGIRTREVLATLEKTLKNAKKGIAVKKCVPQKRAAVASESEDEDEPQRPQKNKKSKKN